MKEKRCSRCAHHRVCNFIGVMSKKSLWVFFKNYNIHLFAIICDNYIEEKEENL